MNKKLLIVIASAVVALAVVVAVLFAFVFPNTIFKDADKKEKDKASTSDTVSDDETSENGNSDGSTDTSDKTEASDSTASDDFVSDDPTDYEKDEIDENTIGVVASKVEATAGGYVTVPVKLTSNPGFVAMLFNVEYDPAVLEFTTCDDGDIITGTQLNTENKGTIAVLWDDANNADMAKTGTLLNLKFKVIGKAGANSEIKLSVPKDGGFVSFEKENYVSYSLVSGSVTVK